MLFYNARYYDPAIGRFISADTVVPGNASGSMDGVALRPLTVAFHEPGFIATLNSEGAQADKLHWGGPANPQALNRYSYVMNNPMRWTDPSGHVGYSHEVSGENRLHLTHEEAIFLFKTLQEDATFYLGLSGNALENKTVAGFAQYLVSKLGALVVGHGVFDVYFPQS